jgi:hypothetical protein
MGNFDSIQSGRFPPSRLLFVESFAPKLSVDWPADLLHNPRRLQSKVSGFCQGEQ